MKMLNLFIKPSLESMAVLTFGYSGWDYFMFNVLPYLIIGPIVILLFGVIFLGIRNGIKEKKYNDAQPILNVHAKVITKRAERSRSSESSSTYYYMTFETENGQRHEFSVQGKEYGLLADGDEGTLTYQGSRYQGFKRAV